MEDNRRYPGRNQPGGKKQLPQRSAGQLVRLWVLALCCALPSAIVVYVTQSFWKGAGVFLVLVVVLGLLLHQVEKQLAKKQGQQ